MKTRLLPLLKPFALPAYFLAWVAYFAHFWSRAVSLDAQGNFLANHVNIWGDWAAHFTMGSSLAYRSLWLVESPLILGAKFSYPYLNDWISAVLIQWGVSFTSAFTIPSFLTSILMVWALFYFFKTVFKSRTVAMAASLIFLLNGGLGFIYFGQDILNSSQPLTVLFNPPHEYTRIDELGIKWISVIDSMMIPQRAFALGFPLTLIALAWVYQVMVGTTPWKKNLPKLVGAGLLLGIMPIAHTHSFLAAGIILSFWMLADLWQHRTQLKPRLPYWLVVGGVTGSLAIPIFLFFFANQVHGFISWYPGWLAKEYGQNWLLFWALNWGITPILAVVGYLVACKSSIFTHFTRVKYAHAWSALIWAPFFLLFILTNLWLFQPFAWDNTKLIVWAAVGFSGLVGHLLVTRKSTVGKIAAVVLFAITIASGSIDAYRIQRINLHSYQMYSAEELQLAEWVKTNTSPDALWLTGNQHNHWLFNLTGRQALMTYPGWLWTHGYDYRTIENDLYAQYQNPSSNAVLKKYGIKYVVVGPQEKSIGATLSEWEKYYPVIDQTDNYSLFQVE